MQIIKKLQLQKSINKFYHIFGEAIGSMPTHTKLRDLNNTDFLLGVQFDIKEALECYESDEMHIWLKKLSEQITTIREAPKHSYKPFLKATAITIAIVSSLVVGLHFGRTYTIRQAELLEVTNTEYYINFGDEVHIYTFE